MPLPAASRQPLAHGAAGGAGDGAGEPCGLGMVPGLQEKGKPGRYVLTDTFSLSLCRKRAKTTLDWRGMRSPPCWKTPCLQRSKSSRSKLAAKQKLNKVGPQPSLQHSVSGGRAASPSVAALPQTLVPGLWASLDPVFLPVSGQPSCSSSLTV